MGKVTIEMSVADAIVALSEGNPGALSTLCQLFKAWPKIDPQGIDITPIVFLSEWGIYGPRIWILFSDVCSRSVIATATIIRAKQLGIISLEELKLAIENRGQGIKDRIEELSLKVRELLPQFADLTFEAPHESTSP